MALANNPPVAWVSAGTLPVALSGAGVLSYNGVLYVAGGTLTSGTSASIYSCPIEANGSLNSNKWALVGSLPASRTQLKLTRVGQNLIAAGGLTSSGTPAKTVYVYNMTGNGGLTYLPGQSSATFSVGGSTSAPLATALDNVLLI